MDALRVTIVGMAGRTFFNDLGLIPFPWGDLVNAFVTVFALNLIYEMSAFVMLLCFLFMTAMAGCWFRVDFGSFLLWVNFEIGNIIVAAIARINAMNRS